jgi:hypothetical protein
LDDDAGRVECQGLARETCLDTKYMLTRAESRKDDSAATTARSSAQPRTARHAVPVRGRPAAFSGTFK